MVEAAAALYSRLSGDGSLATLVPGGVWETRAPVDVVTYPLLTFALLPSRTDYTNGGPWRHVFDLRVTSLDVGESVDYAAAALARVYSLLQDADDTALPMLDFGVLYCRKQTGIKQAPIREGEQFQQLIDGYRLEVTPR